MELAVIQHALLPAVKMERALPSMLSATGTPRCVCHRYKYVTVVVASRLLLVNFSSHHHADKLNNRSVNCCCCSLLMSNVHMRSSRKTSDTLFRNRLQKSGVEFRRMAPISGAGFCSACQGRKRNPRSDNLQYYTSA